MAQVKWSDDTAFPPGSALIGTEKFPGLDGAVNKKWTANQLATFITALITDSAPGTLDTLNELAAALGDDPNFATTVTNALATKLPLAGGTMAGDIALGGTHRVIDSAAPTSPGHLTTKDYVDTLVAALIPNRQNFTPASSGSVTIAASSSAYIEVFMNHSSAVTTLTVNMPTPVDGQHVLILWREAVTGLTMASGASFVGGITSAGAASRTGWIYNATTGLWHRYI